jgi:hypothetical protein
MNADGMVALLNYRVSSMLESPVVFTMIPYLRRMASPVRVTCQAVSPYLSYLNSLLHLLEARSQGSQTVILFYRQLLSVVL